MKTKNTFNYAVLIDDDLAANVYHSLVVRSSKMVLDHKSFQDPKLALQFLTDSANNSNSDLIFPDLILLDINMPVLNGWELIEELSKLDNIKLPPIVMLSSSNYQKDIDLANSNPHVAGFLKKPLEKEDLEKLANELIDKNV